ncbi:transporter [Cerasicoccus frondis]|uniref:transporter n=1 Tax=Cerasicoccus frondis TaxID=490090 RepID=UPI00285262C8|nr:transporter [Cerasicoccus frondis]
MTKITPLCLAVLTGCLAPLANADESVGANSGFAKSIHPVTNPVNFDSALPSTIIRPIFLYQSMPSSISTQAGDVALGGDLQLYAMQAEVALNERFSIVAAKDGYIVFNPDNTLVDAEGWANLAAGVKWAFIYDPEDNLAISLKTIIELPTGNTDVWQGGKYYAITPSVGFLKMWGDFQLSSETGFVVSLNDNGSDEFFSSWHASYGFWDMFFPLVELNYFQVISPGNGNPRFGAQAGGAVPSIVNFEGGDLVNFGASNSDVYSSIVTAAVGFRVRPIDSVDIGAAFEVPVTQTSHNLMQNRVTVDVVWSF